MKTIEQLTAFAEGYAHARWTGDLSSSDDWVIWDEYDINITGADYAEGLQPFEVSVNVYPVNWTDSLPAPIHTFKVQGA